MSSTNNFCGAHFYYFEDRDVSQKGTASDTIGRSNGWIMPPATSGIPFSKLIAVVRSMRQTGCGKASSRSLAVIVAAPVRRYVLGRVPLAGAAMSCLYTSSSGALLTLT